MEIKVLEEKKEKTIEDYFTVSFTISDLCSQEQAYKKIDDIVDRFPDQELSHFGFRRLDCQAWCVHGLPGVYHHVDFYRLAADNGLDRNSFDDNQTIKKMLQQAGYETCGSFAKYISHESDYDFGTDPFVLEDPDLFNRQIADNLERSGKIDAFWKKLESTIKSQLFGNYPERDIMMSSDDGFHYVFLEDTPSNKRYCSIVRLRVKDHSYAEGAGKANGFAPPDIEVVVPDEALLSGRHYEYFKAVRDAVDTAVSLLTKRHSDVSEEVLK